MLPCFVTHAPPVDCNIRTWRQLESMQPCRHMKAVSSSRNPCRRCLHIKYAEAFTAISLWMFISQSWEKHQYGHHVASHMEWVQVLSSSAIWVNTHSRTKTETHTCYVTDSNPICPQLSRWRHLFIHTSLYTVGMFENVESNILICTLGIRDTKIPQQVVTYSFPSGLMRNPCLSYTKEKTKKTEISRIYTPEQEKGTTKYAWRALFHIQSAWGKQCRRINGHFFPRGVGKRGAHDTWMSFSA